jgi:hypothetical protein
METKTQQKRNPAGKRHEGQLLLLACLQTTEIRADPLLVGGVSS